jgi:pyruvate oxidase
MSFGALSEEAKEQRAGEWPVWETDFHNPSFAAFADLCGGKGFQITQLDQIETTLSDALSTSGPSLVEIVTDADLI